MPVAMINTITHDINNYPNFKKNELHDGSMGTKKILNVQYDFWKETPKPKRMLLVGVHLQLKMR